MTLPATGGELQVAGVGDPSKLLELTRLFFGKHQIQFLVNKMQEFRNFVPHNCFLIYDAAQVYLKLKVNNLKKKEVTANPKS